MNRLLRLQLNVAMIAACLGVMQVHAQDAPPEVQPASTDLVEKQVLDPVANRWLLLCCGLPGDDGHRERLTRACEQILSAAEPVLGVTSDRLRFLAGDEEMQDALTGSVNQSDVCTADSMATAMTELASQVKPQDACWVIVLGHAHLYDNKSQFNILDSDIDQTDFAVMAKALDCQEQVFWITTPISGFWIKPLAGKSRVIITATEADLEFTGTEMPYALGDLLTSSGEETTFEDVDQDGNLSLLDLYLSVNLEIHGRFESTERLQTEHAQLEDNQDGRGSEVQLPYIPVPDEEKEETTVDETEPEDTENADEEPNESESSADAEESASESGAPKKVLPKPIDKETLDGYRSRFILLKAPQA